jgi:hypothetical protein
VIPSQGGPDDGLEPIAERARTLLTQVSQHIVPVGPKASIGAGLLT